MAKKRAAKKTTKNARKTGNKNRDEQIILDPAQDKVLKLVDRSAKVQAELEQAVTLAAAKALRKVMKDHGIALDPSQASLLTSILFGE